VNVLTLIDRLAVVDEEGCTHCELCIPSCPVFALDIKSQTGVEA
jgi:NAD-dependent dihydropyrimidine dehydrogenase PreA subunit